MGGKARKALMIIAARRGTEKALPEIVQSVGDSDAGTRAAAVQALVALGGSLFAGEWMGLTAIVGIGLVCAGIFMLAAARAKHWS